MDEDLRAQRDLLERLAQGIVRRGLATPALFVLESARPVSFIASQALVTLGPLVQTLLGLRDYDLFTRAIEDRGNVEWLIGRIEALEDERPR